jgi:hypothetical protein
MIKKTSATLEQALEYYKQGFSAIPLLPKTTRAAVSWEHNQPIRANEECNYIDIIR